MAKIKQDRELLKIIDDYKTFINAEKRINAPIIVSMIVFRSVEQPKITRNIQA
jgi:hypothetical protein